MSEEQFTEEIGLDLGWIHLDVAIVINCYVSQLATLVKKSDQNKIEQNWK